MLTDLTPASARPAPIRLLVVDDDEADRLAVRRLLAQSGLATAVDEAGAADQVLERIAAGGYDCLLLDYYLPGVEGQSLLQAVRHAAADLPVVIFTGRGDEDVAVELMKGGAIDYLPKATMTPERLASGVRHALELARAAAEQRRAEDELRAQEARFRTLANVVPQLVWMADDDGSVIWLNDRWYAYTGTTFDDACGWAWRSLVHPDDVARVMGRIRSAIAGGIPWEDTIRLRARDGVYGSFLTRAVPIRAADGTVTGWVGTHTDFTERRWTEALLDGERRALELLARSSPLREVLGVLCDVVEDLAGDGLLASILLLDAGGSALRHGAARSLPEDYNRAVDGLPVGPRSGSCGTAAFRGEVVVVEDIATDPLWADYRDIALAFGLRACWSTPVRGSDGQVLGSFAMYYRQPRAPSPEHRHLASLVARTAAVVIERKRADDVRARLVAIVDSSDDAIARATAEGIVTDWNAGATRLYGYTAEEMLGQPISRIVPPTRRDEYEGVLARVRRGERVPAFDTERRDKERRPIEVSLSLSPIRDEAGHVVGISAIARDIAERRRLEAEREWLLLAERAARAEAEAAVRAHDELLAIVTHDLKNPLAAIQGYAQLLRRKARRGDTVGLETFGETLSQIEDGARRMGTMLGELLDSARLQAGRALELDPQPADLAELARRVAGWQTGTGVAPQIRVDATEAVECSCDQARLERAVDNLIGNAVKYSPDGGQILVRVERDGAWAVLSIRDHGIGIPVADKPRLFERFHRCANALGRFSGTGIGLASVRQIVEAHGGTIAVESEEGEGTTFTVRIPLRAPRRCEPGRGPDRQQMRTSGTDGP